MRKSLFKKVFEDSNSYYFSNKIFWVKYIVDNSQKKVAFNTDFIGIITSKKLGNAVIRNKIKRQMLSILKEKEFFEGNYIFGFTSGKFEYIKLKEEVDNFFEKTNIVDN